MINQTDCVKQKNIEMLNNISILAQRTIDLLLAQVDDNILSKSTSAKSLEEFRCNIQDVIIARLKSFSKVGE